MGPHREKTPMFFTRLTHSLGRKQRSPSPAIDRSPAPQTSLVFQLPDELILRILSHIIHMPRHTDCYARFRIQDDSEPVGTDRYRQLEADFLRPLSMTCRAMRLRLIPWIWEYLQLPSQYHWGPARGDIVSRGLDTIAGAFYADKFLATSVKFMILDLAGNASTFPPFVRCLQSLPSLHTLEIARVEGPDSTRLKSALKGVKLPQIKTLIFPPAAYPLLQPCLNVEDVVCAAGDRNTLSDGFLRFFKSNRDSKVRRLAIPLVTWANPSKFVAVCPRLTELTIFFPHRYTTGGQMDFLPGHAQAARSAISELVGTCKTLPDFDTLQIVRFPVIPPTPHCTCGWGRWGVCECPVLSQEEQDWMTEGLKKKMKDLEEWAMDCLRESKAEEGEGRGTTLRVIEFGWDNTRVKAEEYEV